jgi:crossover junction endodeoxyribonuclease RusA
VYLCLVLPFPPTVNNLFAGKGRRFPSMNYKNWQAEAALALAAQGPLPSFAGKVALTFTFGRPDNRRRDLFNYVKAPEDALVRHGILVDDSLVEFGAVKWAPDVTGCRVEIEALEP